MNAELPPAAPDVVAAAVETLTSRLRKKLDAAIETYAALPVTADGAALRVRCGEDAEVTLTPGPSGTVTDAERAVCSCLLAPRCLHRAAVLSACPVADTEAEGVGTNGAAADAVTETDGPAGTGTPDPGGSDDATTTGGSAADNSATGTGTGTGTPGTPHTPAAALWAGVG
ncbi:SWIM zinc finger family protein, partial [Streptomyces scabiei]